MVPRLPVSYRIWTLWKLDPLNGLVNMYLAEKGWDANSPDASFTSSLVNNKYVTANSGQLPMLKNDCVIVIIFPFFATRVAEYL